MINAKETYLMLQDIRDILKFPQDERIEEKLLDMMDTQWRYMSLSDRVEVENYLVLKEQNEKHEIERS